MKKYLYSFCCITLVFIISCVTTKFYQEPNENITTLVIGKAKLFAKGFTGKDSFFNGTHTSGIELHLIDQQNNELIRLQSKGKNGLFYSTELVPGKYKIGRISFKKKETAGVRWRAVSTNINMYVEIKEGIVNNLGEFNYDVNDEAYYMKVFYNTGYFNVISAFEKQFPESQWLQKERDFITLEPSGTVTTEVKEQREVRAAPKKLKEMVHSPLDLYKLQLAFDIQKKWKFNHKLPENKNNLVTQIAFNVMPDGTIKDIWFDKKSGYEPLDKSVYKAIIDASPVRPHPKGISEPYVTVGLRFSPQGVK